MHIWSSIQRLLRLMQLWVYIPQARVKMSLQNQQKSGGTLRKTTISLQITREKRGKRKARKRCRIKRLRDLSFWLKGASFTQLRGKLIFQRQGCSFSEGCSPFRGKNISFILGSICFLFQSCASVRQYLIVELPELEPIHVLAFPAIMFLQDLPC